MLDSIDSALYFLCTLAIAIVFVTLVALFADCAWCAWRDRWQARHR